MSEQVKGVTYRLFMSESGDHFAIPETQFDADVQEYEKFDDESMLNFEEGNTGWIYIPDVSKFKSIIT